MKLIALWDIYGTQAQVMSAGNYEYHHAQGGGSPQVGDEAARHYPQWVWGIEKDEKYGAWFKLADLAEV